MGLFNNLVAEPETQSSNRLTHIEALCGILVASLFADGKVSKNEKDLNIYFISKNRFLLKEENPEKIVQKVMELAQQSGIDSFIDVCVEALPQDWKKPTFAIVADLMFADGTPCQSNIELLNGIYKKLEIPANEAVPIVNVIKQLHYFDL